MTLEEKFKQAGQDGQPFRGAPFWSWNDDLDPRELSRQVAEMKRGGLGGHFMHARIGLITPYLSPQWMECIRATVEASAKVGMDAWLYDEDCWPSGSAGGRVPAKGEEYLQKYLVAEETLPDRFSPTPHTLAVFSGIKRGKAIEGLSPYQGNPLEPGISLFHFHFKTTGYVDLLSEKVVRAFIEEDYECYAPVAGEHFGKTVPGIFTDEPQYRHVPWSLELPDYFRKLCGYDLIKALPSLFYEVGDYPKVRYDFWSTVTRMFVEHFTRQIGQWCESHNLIFTGHFMAEDSLLSQIHHIGAAMPHYEYMQMPGIDHLGRNIAAPILPKQVSSVAHQRGGKRVLSEMFGCAGWNVSLEELKWIAEWQYALGVDFPCQHLSLYSLRGCRKRDYPPSLHYQQPWWPDYRLLNDYFARLLAILTEGRHVADILLLHPIGSAWTVHDPSDPSSVWEIHAHFVRLSNDLLALHRDYDYGDEFILAAHGEVVGNRLQVGDAIYSIVIVPPSLSWRQSTLELLEQFMRQGGHTIFVRPLPTMVEGMPLLTEQEAETVLQDRAVIISNEREALEKALDAMAGPRIRVVDIRTGEEAPTIYLQQRDCGERQFFFLANTSRERAVQTLVMLRGEGILERWDLESGAIDILAVERRDHHTLTSLYFAGMQSHLLAFRAANGLDAGADIGLLPANPTAEDVIDLTEGPWQCERLDSNALTLDYASYSLDGSPWSDHKYILHIQEEVAALGRDVQVSLRFRFQSKLSKAESLFLVMELPEEFEIKVNGQPVAYQDIGWWRDIAFKKVEIASCIRQGENIIELTRPFLADPRTLQARQDAVLHESIGNRLCYGVELESIYLIGDFAVESESPITYGERQAAFTQGPFILTDKKQDVLGGALIAQGLPFFAGTVRLRRIIREADLAGRSVCLELDPPDAIVTRVRVNGREAGVLAWRPYLLDISEYCQEGENTLEIELTNSCRNLLGPHHHIDGELFAVGPGSFTGKRFWTDRPDAPENTWTDRYCFVRFGLNGVRLRIS